MFGVNWRNFTIYSVTVTVRRSKRTSKPIYNQKHRSMVPYAERRLQWGAYGVRLLGRFSITRRRTWFLKLWLKWYHTNYYRRKPRRVDLKKKGQEFFRRHGYGMTWKKTLRAFYWLRARRAIPILHKSNKARMGKGRGKLYSWLTHVRAGTILVEFSNYKKQWADRLAIKVLHERLPCDSQYVVSQQLRRYPVISGRYRESMYFDKSEFMFATRKRASAIMLWRMRPKANAI